MDLRPYILYGKEIFVLPGGLTRVALKKGFAGGEFLAGRRQQGHLGAGRFADAGARAGLQRRRQADAEWRASRDAQPRSRFRLLDEPLHRTRRERGAVRGREHPSSCWTRPRARISNGRRWSPSPGDQAEFAKRYGLATEKNVIQFLTFDAENPNSILSCLRAARENARSVREIISSEMWLQLNRFYLMVNSAAQESGGLE